MNDLEKQLKEAFGSVHAEDSLKKSAVDFVERERERKKMRFSLRWTKLAAAAACMLLLFLSGYGTRMFFEPVSVISIDINPSIELGINTFDRVVSADAFNADGEALLQDLDLRLRSWEDALEQVVGSPMVQELLNREEALTLTVVGKEEAEAVSLCTRLEDYVGGIANAQCLHASPETLESAHPSGLSYGKYLAYLEALETNGNLTPEDVQDMTMKQLHELAGGSCGHGRHGNEAGETEPSTEAAEETTFPTETPHGHGKKNHKKGHH